MLESEGVLFATLLIALFLSLTVLVSVWSLCTAKNLLVQMIGVLATAYFPTGHSLRAVPDRLRASLGVRHGGDFHVHGIAVRQLALRVYLFLDCSISVHLVLKQAQQMLSDDFLIDHSTIQIDCEEKASHSETE